MRDLVPLLRMSLRSFMAALLLGALFACGGDGDGDGTGSGDTTTPTPPPELRITSAGTPTGAATTTTVTPAGGAARAAGASVQVPAGAFAADTALAMQAISNPIEDGLPALSLTSSEPLLKPLTVSLPLVAGEPWPETLRLATREADGSWVVLEPVTLDRAAGTVSATLPVAFAPAATARAHPLSTAAGQRLDLRNVIAFHLSYLSPESATVRTGGRLRLVPYAVVTEWNSNLPSECRNGSTSELAPVCRRVTRAYPYTNDKAGYFRSWSVNGIAGGDAESVGTISPDTLAGATYTAPKRKPQPDTVTITFHSQSATAADQHVDVSASVKIVDDPIQTYVGPIEVKGRLSGGATWSGKGDLTWTLDPDGHLEGDLNRYTASGTIVATFTQSDCDPATAPVPMTGALVVFDPTRSGDGDPYAHKHWFTLTPSRLVTATTACGTPRRAQTVAISFSVFTACGTNPALPDAPRYADIALLAAVGSWSCTSMTNDVSYSFEAR